MKSLKNKAVSAALLFAFTVPLFAVEFSMRALPSYDFLFANKFSSTFGVAGSFDVSAFTFRGTDDLFFSVQEKYLPLKAKGLEPYTFLDTTITAGYDYGINDRFTACAELGAGYWTIPKELSGLSFSGRLSAYYNIFPELSAGAYVGFGLYSGGKTSFVNSVELGISLKYNFSRGLFGKTNITLENSRLENIFPVFYSWYQKNSFGCLTFKNDEKNDITDLEVSIFIEQYMSNPEVCARIDRVKRGDTFEVELTAFLNETILLNLEASKADAKVTISYKSLGRRVQSVHSIELQTLNRNNMTWEDDRRAACFVSAKDGSARYFANHVRSAVKDSLKSGIPENVQYAQAMFGALKAYGINYVIDASSAFTANTGTAQIDSLNFPYQTLLYHGGDCDDLTILNCSLLEALGIQTALVTVPGHIYMAVDTGLAVQEVSGTSNASKYVIQDNKVWLLVEVTLCQDTWDEAKRYGLREWNKYAKERRLYPLEQAWELYKPIGIADSNMTLDLPTKKQIVQEFSKTF